MIVVAAAHLGATAAHIWLWLLAPSTLVTTERYTAPQRAEVGVLHQPSSLGFLLSIACVCACGQSHEPAPQAVPTCADSSCLDAGRFADGGIRMPARPAASDAGARDASLSTNMIDQPDAGTPTCHGGACSAYRVRGGFVSNTTSSATSGLRVSEQRISGMPVSCGDVHGARLCVRGGVR